MSRNLAPMAIQTHKLTVEQFSEQYSGQPYELVNGEVVYVAPSGMLVSYVALQIGTYINLFVNEHDLGWTTTADGDYKLDEENLRAPDVAFTRHERLTQQDRTKYSDTPPDLAVEVVSPTDRAADVQQKVSLYLANGVRLVWVVYPQVREVMVYYPDGRAQTLREPASLDGEDVLPGFLLALKSIFPKADDS